MEYIWDDNHTKEKKMKRASPDYLENVQKCMDANVRGILVDWLVVWANKLRLVPDTVHLAVSYMDRYLSQHTIADPHTTLHLLVNSALLVATKQSLDFPCEDKNHQLHIGRAIDFCLKSNDIYTREDVLDMEAALLKSLNFEVRPLTTISFLQGFATIDNPSFQSKMLSCYLGELSLLEYECLRFPPSLVAASAVFLSNYTLSPEDRPWSANLQLYSGYEPADLKECVFILHDLQLKRRAGTLTGATEKYKWLKFQRVSTLIPPLNIPDSYFQQWASVEEIKLKNSRTRHFQQWAQVEEMKRNFHQQVEENKTIIPSA